MSKEINIYPLSRVEGDLEIRVELENGTVSDAHSAGTMYRGFENIMVGRAPLDALVITPRICGICSTSHLYTAARALDMLFDVEVPPNAIRIRNITLMVEILQNDFRHAFMLFMPDFTNPAYKDHPLYEQMVERYAPLKGSTTRQAIDATRKVLEIISILGGQWPHSSFIVPGGVVSRPSANELMRCAYLLKNFRHWYEKRVLGCRLEKWPEIKSKADLMSWLDEDEAHTQSDLGCYMRFAISQGLDRIGKGYGNYISYGIPAIKPESAGKDNGQMLLSPSGGFYSDNRLSPLDHGNISEDVSHSWFLQQGSAQHPYNGQSTPYATGSEGKQYSWAKAPRYTGLPAETGPLSEVIIAADPLFTDLLGNDGPSVFLRQLARMVRAARIIPILERHIKQAAVSKREFYEAHGEIEHSKGHGLVEAPRGALGHWLNIEDDKITSYQIITPTAWNASPRDSKGLRGPWEEALVGAEIKNPENPVEIHHIIRSFDPCLVCTVHAIDLNRGSGSIIVRV